MSIFTIQEQVAQHAKPDVIVRQYKTVKMYLQKQCKCVQKHTIYVKINIAKSPPTFHSVRWYPSFSVTERWQNLQHSTSFTVLLRTLVYPLNLQCSTAFATLLCTLIYSLSGICYICITIITNIIIVSINVISIIPSLNVYHNKDQKCFKGRQIIKYRVK